MYANARATFPRPVLALSPNWDRLAGQRRLVDRRRVQCDSPVDRNDFARPHQESVADRDPTDRHVLDPVVDPTMCQAWRAIDQRAQIMARAGNEKPAARWGAEGDGPATGAAAGPIAAVGAAGAAGAGAAVLGWLPHGPPPERKLTDDSPPRVAWTVFSSS
jgi:hypothetical protein